MEFEHASVSASFTSATTSASTARVRRIPVSARRPSAMYSAFAGITSETTFAELPLSFVTRRGAAGRSRRNLAVFARDLCLVAPSTRTRPSRNGDARLGDRDGLRVGVHEDEAPSERGAHGAESAAPGEGVEAPVPGAGRGLHHAPDDALGLLRRVPRLLPPGRGDDRVPPD